MNQAKKIDGRVSWKVALEALEVAREHQGKGGMSSSARLCADDANEAFARQDYARSFKRSIDSLKYSLGIFSPVLQAVEGMVA